MSNLIRSFLILLIVAGFSYLIIKQISSNPHDLDTYSKAQIALKINSSPAFQKQKGAHVFGIDDSTDFQIIKDMNIEWVTIVPWGFQQDFNSPKVSHHNGDSTIIRNGNDNLLKRIRLLHSNGFKVFVKPHVWMDTPPESKWRSDIFPDDDKNWKSWKDSYRDFILRYATVAEEAKTEMFCVGTEFTRLSIEKPEFWKSLIKEVRKVYSGKLTYAANWYKEYEKITFWDELDYIGVQAYFPLTNKKLPSSKEIARGWKKYTSSLKAVHKKYNRKIIFTEIGYKSTADSAISPWEWVDDPYSNEKAVSFETQSNCYEAFFKTIWKKDWFAGIHLWQLRGDHKKLYENKENLDFTPLEKPAAIVITNGFE